MKVSRIQESGIRRRKTRLALAGRGGFTLIELLVAMAILVVITLIVAKIFQQAGVAWDTGTRKAESMMAGRAVSDFIAQQLSRAVPDPGGAAFSVSGSSLNFYILGDAGPGTGAIQKVQYSASQLADGLSDGDIVVNTYGGTAGLPAYGIVTVTMSSNVFQTGFSFLNWNRNRL
jgi:prepilin-type N-terminal cleavage/methylation domain-containing protein